MGKSSLELLGLARTAFERFIPPQITVTHTFLYKHTHWRLFSVTDFKNATCYVLSADFCIHCNSTVERAQRGLTASVVTKKTCRDDDARCCTFCKIILSNIFDRLVDVLSTYVAALLTFSIFFNFNTNSQYTLIDRNP